jgi:hypothetical protein
MLGNAFFVQERPIDDLALGITVMLGEASQTSSPVSFGGVSPPV